MAGFYFKNTDGQLIPAGFLIDSLGNPVNDQNAAKTGPLSSTFYNYDGTVSKVSNSINVMVASLGYSLNYSAAVGFLIEDSPPGVGILSMGVSFTQGTQQDLQRNYIDANGLPVFGAAPVPAFQDIASLHLGIVGYLVVFPRVSPGGEAEVDIAAQDCAVKGVFWRRPAADVGRQLLPSRTTHPSKSVSRSRGNRFAQIEGAKWMLKIASACLQ